MMQASTRDTSRDQVIMLAASFFYLASPMLVNPLITGFTETLGASVVSAGLLSGLMNLCSLVMRPIGGNLSDRKNRKVLACLGAGLMALTCFGYAFAQTPLFVAVLRVGNGVGYSLVSVCMSSWFASILPADSIGSGMGTFGMMNALGMAIGPALGVMVQGSFGYRPALAVAGALAMTCSLLVLVVADSGDPKVAGKRVGAAANKTSAPSDKSILARLLDVRAIPAALTCALFTIPYTATQSFVVSYAAERGDGLVVSMFFPIYACALLALRYVLRRSFDEVSFRTFLIASSASALASFFFLWQLRDNIGLFLAAIFMSGGYGVMCSVCQSTAVRLVGQDRSGIANSTYYMGLDIGMTLGPVLGGAIIGFAGTQALYPVLAICVPLAWVVHALLGSKWNTPVSRKA